MATRTNYHVGGFLPAAPQQNRRELWDSVAGTYTAWNTSGAVTTSRALTTAEAADLTAADATNTSLTNAATLRSRALTALDANATFLALASPTNAQVVAQVQKLTRECNGLIRLALSQLDDTTGT